MVTRTLVLGFLAFALLFLPGTSFGQGRIYLLIAADTNDQNIFAKQDVSSIYNAIRYGGFSEGTCVPTELTGGNFTAERFQDELNRLANRCGKDDALVVFYSGHGFFAGGYQLAFNQAAGQTVSFDDALNTMEQSQARLKVLVSDACAIARRERQVGVAGAQWGERVPPGMAKLFLRARGSVALVSASENQVALSKQSVGGLFTSKLTSTISNNRDKESITWDSVFATAQKATYEAFMQDYPNGYSLPTGGNQRTQNPKKIKLEVSYDVALDNSSSNGGEMPPVTPPQIRPGEPLDSLGVSLAQDLTVTKVVPGSPATKCEDDFGNRGISLEPGDILFSINGVDTLSLPSTRDALRRSPDRLQFQVIRARSREVLTLRTQLAGNDGGGNAGDNNGGEGGNNDGGNGNGMGGAAVFGAELAEDINGRVVVTTVQPGSPATRCADNRGNNAIYLEPGDQIASINGRPVRGVLEAMEMIRKSPPEMRFEIVNVNDGEVLELRARLRPGGNGGGDNGNGGGGGGFARLGIFGVDLQDDGNGQVVVVNVQAGSPATRCADSNGNSPIFLERGDALFSINGRRIRNVAEAQDAIQNSPALMRFQVIDVKNGGVVDLRTQLPVDGGGNEGGGNGGDGNAGGGDGGMAPNFGGTLGINMQADFDGNVVIVFVRQGGAATRCRVPDGRQFFVEAGDILLSINGQRVNSVAEAQAAIKQSPQRMKFQIINSRDGQVVDLVTELD